MLTHTLEPNFFVALFEFTPVSSDFLAGQRIASSLCYIFLFGGWQAVRRCQ